MFLVLHIFEELVKAKTKSMQFKDPEILYALFFLIIPIIVHLFQLQRFKKTPFTNVQFLKKIAQQSRKSATIKKWLILVTRLGAFTFIIIAFSQPFSSNFSKNTQHHTVIYLDNSYSMQGLGDEGELLKRSVQNLLKSLPKNEIVSFITNNNSYKNIRYNDLKKILLSLNYSPRQLDFKTLLLKIKQLTHNKTTHQINVLLISDFQVHKKFNWSYLDPNNRYTYTCIQLSPQNRDNASIDSVFITKKTVSMIQLAVIVRHQKFNSETVISLYNGKRLIGKKNVTFEKKHVKKIIFPLAFNNDFKGHLQLNDPALSFDNSFYFNISKPEKINILSIGKKADFLARIFTNDEFHFTQNSLQGLAYNSINEQHTIILNELDAIPKQLIQPLKDFVIKGGSLSIIPANNAAIATYNYLFQQLEIGKLETAKKQELKITDINYEHPLLRDVFKKRVANFQYPTTKQQFKRRGKKGIKILGLENKTPFFESFRLKDGSIYFCVTPLNPQNSNFQQSSLIVPLFYNIGRQSFTISQLYYTLGNKKDAEVAIGVQLNSNEIISLSNEKEAFIPLQQRFPKKVSLQLDDKPTHSGHFDLKSPIHNYGRLAFNHPPSESNLNYTVLESLEDKPKNVYINNSTTTVNQQIKENQKINWLFKWFLALSVVFLIFEMLILKYFKL